MKYIILNMICIVAGGFISGNIKKFISKTQVDAVLLITNICIAVIGIQGAIATKEPVLLIVSCVIGAIVGTAFDLDGKLNSFRDFLKRKFKGTDDHFVKGFLTVFMVQCIGSMAIIGPLDLGLQNDPSIMIFKIILDTCSSVIYGAMYGYGVALSGPFVFLYEAVIFLMAEVLSPLLTTQVVNEISAVGSVLIFALSLDLLNIVRIKIANYLPALLGPIIYGLICILIK